MANFNSAILATATLILCEITSVSAQIVDRPVVSGRRAVVTSDDPLASMAGMRMLQQGGNAFDAAVAAAIAIGVLDPRMASIGGNGFATVYVAKSREVRALNFYGSAVNRQVVVHSGGLLRNTLILVDLGNCNSAAA